MTNVQPFAAQASNQARQFRISRGISSGNHERVGARQQFRAIGWQETTVCQYEPQYHIAHSETDGRRLWSAEEFNKSVIATATCNGAFAAGRFVNFKHRAGVVGQTAHNPKVKLAPIGEPRSHQCVAQENELCQRIHCDSRGGGQHSNVISDLHARSHHGFKAGQCIACKTQCCSALGEFFGRHLVAAIQ